MSSDAAPSPKDLTVTDILRNPGEPRAMLETLLLDKALELGAPTSVAAVFSWRKLVEYIIEMDLVDEGRIRRAYLRERLGTRGEVKVSHVGAGGPDGLKVGDLVTWSVGNGVQARGRIVARVPAGLPVDRVPEFYSLVEQFGAFKTRKGQARSYLSWLIAGEHRRGLYWPQPCRLNRLSR